MNKYFCSKVVLSILISICSVGFADEVKKPKDSFNTNFSLAIPIIQHIAAEKKVKVPDFQFPQEKNTSIKPADCYLKIYEVYAELAQKFELPPLEKKKKENIVPGDVVTLTTDLYEILKAKWGSQTVEPEFNKKYEAWKVKSRKGGDEIVPGDVHALASYMLTIAQSLN